MAVPSPTPILRLTHIDNLRGLVERGGLHAPNFAPSGDLAYRTIHNVEIQEKRRVRPIVCRGRTHGVVHD
jgi:hypothetical protein